MNKIFKKFLYLACLGLIVTILPLRLYTWWQAKEKRYANAEDISPQNPPPVAIVFGAGVNAQGKPSAILYDRLATAAELYRNGQVKTVLLSGNNLPNHRYETDVMAQTLSQLGVPFSNLKTDPQGYRTYDTCQHAARDFGIRQAILVTQGFHLDRALYLCEAFGIRAIGLQADRRPYPVLSKLFWSIREWGATFKAWWEVQQLPG